MKHQMNASVAKKCVAQNLRMVVFKPNPKH